VGGPIAQFVRCDLKYGRVRGIGYFTVLSNTLNHDRSDYDGPYVELVVSPVDKATAAATQFTCSLLSISYTHSADSEGYILWGISRILRAWAYLDLVAFCRPSPPNYMKVIMGTGRGAMTLFFASHESSSKVSSDCYSAMVAHGVVMGLIVELSSHVRKCPRCNEAPPQSLGYGFLTTVYMVLLCRVSAGQLISYGSHPPEPVLLVFHSASRTVFPSA
jgi:hypothetical protein